MLSVTSQALRNWDREDKLKPNPVVYTDAYEFVNDMVDNVIPPVIL